MVSRPKLCVGGCGRVATLLCDGEVQPSLDGGPAKTCDAPVCTSCARRKRRYPVGTFICARGPGGSRNLGDETWDYCPSCQVNEPAERRPLYIVGPQR